MMRATLILALLLFWTAFAATGCTPAGESPRATAEAFLDAHYVHIDLEAARPLCVGLALDKLDKEVALTRDAQIDAETRKPRITYRIEESRDGSDRAQYAYVLEIHPDGADIFRKLVVLTLRNESAGWRVSNYTESDKS
jgi:hypothetical protein